MKHITHKARYLWNHVLYPTGAKAGFHYIVLAGQFTRRASNSQYSCLLLSRLPGAGNQVLKQNLRKRTFPLDLLHFGTGCLNWQQLVLLKSPSPFADFPRISTFPPEITWTFFFFFLRQGLPQCRMTLNLGFCVHLPGTGIGDFPPLQPTELHPQPGTFNF